MAEGLSRLGYAGGVEVIDDAGMVRAARTDAAAFAPLYRHYVTPVYRYVYSHVGNAADAEDLTAVVFTQALQQLPHYRERGNFAAWLFTIARRRIADYHRGRPRQVSLDEAEDHPLADAEPQDSLERAEDRERLERLLAGLSESELELLRLRYAAGLKHGQIAVVLGKREAAVKMAVSRLLGRLRQAWGEER
ncbi:MAG: RNA polymerase sigma factor [Anaerolineae bacterium]